MKFVYLEVNEIILVKIITRYWFQFIKHFMLAPMIQYNKLEQGICTTGEGSA
jgi:hypothetical protein